MKARVFLVSLVAACLAALAPACIADSAPAEDEPCVRCHQWWTAPDDYERGEFCPGSGVLADKLLACTHDIAGDCSAVFHNVEITQANESECWNQLHDVCAGQLGACEGDVAP